MFSAGCEDRTRLPNCVAYCLSTNIVSRSYLDVMSPCEHMLLLQQIWSCLGHNILKTTMLNPPSDRPTYKHTGGTTFNSTYRKMYSQNTHLHEASQSSVASEESHSQPLNHSLQYSAPPAKSTPHSTILLMHARPFRHVPVRGIEW